MFSDRVEHWDNGQGLEILQNWVRDGLSEKEIIRRIGIHPATWRKWKKTSPAIAGIARRKPEGADSQIENALLQKASGYTADIAKTYKLKRIEYENGKKVREFEELAQGIDQIHVPADLSAQIFWLKNRRPHRWKEKPGADSGGAALKKLDAVMEEWNDAVKPETK